MLTTGKRITVVTIFEKMADDPLEEAAIREAAADALKEFAHLL
jgi:hypothetical protein